jgi:hypothetical protein
VKEAAILAVLAACTTTEPDPSTLMPSIFATGTETRLSVGVAFEDERNVADVDLTFRGHTSHARPEENSTAANFDIALDHRLDGDEPIIVTVAGIAMTVTAPPPFDGLVVPQFISRSASATISWPSPIAEPTLWATGTSACVLGGGKTAPDATGITFAPTDWLPPTGQSGSPSHATCTTELRLERSRMGSIDPAFQGGSTLVDQRTTVVFASMP